MNTVITLRMALVALLASTHVLAETGLKPAIGSSNTSTDVTVSVPQEKNFLIGVGPGLQVQNSSDGGTGFALGLNGAYRVSKQYPIYVGMDNAWVSRTWWVNDGRFVEHAIQLLPTAFYQFDIPATQMIRPFVGLSMGMYIHNRSYVNNFSSLPKKAWGVVFEMLVRPGCNFMFNETFGVNLEPKFGLLDRGFVFLPQANATFAL